MTVGMPTNMRVLLHQLHSDFKEASVQWTVRGETNYMLSGDRESVDEAVRYCAGYIRRSSSPAKESVTIRGVKDDGRIANVLSEHSLLARGIDDSSLRLLCQSTGDDILCIRYNRSHFYDLTVISPDAIWVAAASTDGPPLYLSLVRALRNHNACQCLDNGELFIHGAAVEIGGFGTLLLGDRRAGKTTQLCELLTQHGAKFISNDRVFLSDKGRLSGAPVSVNLRKPTIDYFAQYQLGSTFSDIHTIGSSRMNGDVSLSVPDFTERLGCGLVPHSELRSIVILEHDPETRGVRIERLTNDSLRDAVLEQQFPHVDKSQPFYKPRTERAKGCGFLEGVSGWRIRAGARTISDTGAAIASIGETSARNTTWTEVVLNA